MQRRVLEHCQSVFPGWNGLTVDDVDFDDPKGFSSFTMGVKPRPAVEPSAAFYRRLAGKENAILDFEAEKRVFLALGDASIAAPCLAYHDDFRIEAFYRGRSLRPDELFEDEVLRQIAQQLHGLHQARPARLPQRSFFELLRAKWGPLAEAVLDQKQRFPAEEQSLCDDLRQLFTPETARRVRQCLPSGALTFCHNDTYHGNIMRLDGGDIRLLDFEFSCLGHPAYDFSNLFAETVMQHRQPDYPFFRIAEPAYSSADLGRLIGHYLDCEDFATESEREVRFGELLRQTEGTLMLSHYVYAMAAIPLALEPVQKIRFIPYAHARFAEFEAQHTRRFG